MQTHYLFVDYENTQLGNLGLIGESSCLTKIKIFLGRHQNMIPIALARALHAFGDDAEYIQVDSARHNAIEFNIAFQLGELATQHPDAQFSILSNDSAFNAIVEGLKSKGIACARYADIESLLAHPARPASVVSDASQGDKVVAITESLNKSKGMPPQRSAK
ncbi:MAG TPA: PIN domain-containing protein [Novimethylophilus sp.]|uniref:PIN domain-containing protein n=1 Tax=Novimethylophilus sp. TaxID=2137426 RepID=UPI002F405A82